MALPERIILTGFMATGKSTVGRALAEKIGYTFFDTDQWIEDRSGKSIPQIFASEGEGRFRELERHAVSEAMSQARTVIAVGGGAVCFPENFQKLHSAGPMVLLTAPLNTILRRAAEQGAARPLLKGESSAKTARVLLEKRKRDYQRIKLQIETDGKTPARIVEEVLQLLNVPGKVLPVKLGAKSYPIYFQQDSFDALKSLMKQHLGTEQAVLVSNPTVFKLYGKKLQAALKGALKLDTILIPDGEQHKNLTNLAKIFTGLAQAKADRKTPVIALGGGVIGDMAGFAAASYLRGVPFVQIPTSLLAQVDSSIGGKTGIDLKEGKNLVGAFYQPKFVLIDEGFLKTLPARQLTCGLAEVIKYAAIFDAAMFKELEQNIERIMKQKGKGMEDIIRRCCEWKGFVVEKDEFDTKGQRAKLNFGHTLGHAVEALTKYRKYTHGEAIAMGMVYAAKLSVAMAGLKAGEVDRLKNLLVRAGLPVDLPRFPRAQYLKALVQDKKRVSKDIHFVYLEKIGKSVVIPTPLEKVLWD